MNRIIHQDVTCEMCGERIPDDSDNNAFHGLRKRKGLCFDCINSAGDKIFNGSIEFISDQPIKPKYLVMPFSPDSWVLLNLQEYGVLSWTVG